MLQNVGGSVESTGAGNSTLNLNGRSLTTATVRQSGTGLLDLWDGNYAGNLTFVGKNVRITGISSFADGSVINGPLTLSRNVTMGNVTANGLITANSVTTLGAGKTLTFNGGVNFSTASSLTGASTLLLGAGQLANVNSGAVFNVDRIDNRGTFTINADP